MEKLRTPIKECLGNIKQQYTDGRKIHEPSVLKSDSIRIGTWERGETILSQGWGLGKSAFCALMLPDGSLPPFCDLYCQGSSLFAFFFLCPFPLFLHFVWSGFNLP